MTKAESEAERGERECERCISVDILIADDIHSRFFNVSLRSMTSRLITVTTISSSKFFNSGAMISVVPCELPLVVFAVVMSFVPALDPGANLSSRLEPSTISNIISFKHDMTFNCTISFSFSSNDL